jgi:type II secretory pathway pseudopilin PulG
MTVIVILGILAVITLGVLGKMRGRARRAQCMTNLRNLHVGAELYVQQNGAWPHIRRTDYPNPRDFANQWIDALSPHGVQRATWICPSIQEQLQNPDYATPEEARIDYVATPFDDKPVTPHQWKTQPWFIEVGDVHGNGNLMIFTDGSISDLNTVAK